MGQHPLIIQQKLRITQCGLNIVLNKSSLLVKQTYVIPLYTDTINNSNEANWASEIFVLLRYGTHIWVVNNKLYFRREYMQDHFKQDWLRNINTKPSTMLYFCVLNRYL